METNIPDRAKKNRPMESTERNFLIELGVSAVASVAIVLLAA